jgi:hypothetical protein
MPDLQDAPRYLPPDERVAADIGHRRVLMIGTAIFGAVLANVLGGRETSDRRGIAVGAQ